MIQGIEGGRPLEDDGPFPLALGRITCRFLQFERAGVIAFVEDCLSHIDAFSFLFSISLFCFVVSTAAANRFPLPRRRLGRLLGYNMHKDTTYNYGFWVDWAEGSEQMA